MSRLLACLTRTAPWALAALAVLFGGLAVVWCGYAAAYFWFQTQPRSLPIGLLWFAVALSIPISAEAARRFGLSRGEHGGALVTRVSATTLLAVWCVLSLVTVLRFAGALLSS
jgi:hypothetical protein